MPEYNLFPKQKLLLDFAVNKLNKDVNVCIYGGAIRGGKTMAGAILGGILCTLIPGYKWYVVRATQHRLISTTIPSYAEVFRSAQGVDHKKKTAFKIPFRNGSEINFLPESFSSDKELNRFRGLEANGFHLDEFNELQEATFNKCVERAGANIIKGITNPKSFVLATCNPTQNWVKERFYLPHKNNSLQKNTRYIQARIFDNPFIPPDYTEHLKNNLSPIEYETFVNGNWDIMMRTGFEFYKEFKIDKHVKTIDYDPSLPLWLSLDENVNPYLSCSIWQIDDTKAYAIEEICLSNPRNNLFALCAEIKHAYQHHKAGLFITGDATSLKRDVKLSHGSNFYTIIEEELKELYPQIRVPDSNPHITTRGLFINRIFANKLDINISISDKCTNLIIDLQNLKEKGDGTKLKQRETKEGVSYEKLGHLSDTMDYLITQVFQTEYDKFINGETIPLEVVKYKRRNYVY